MSSFLARLSLVSFGTRIHPHMPSLEPNSGLAYPPTLPVPLEQPVSHLREGQLCEFKSVW